MLSEFFPPKLLATDMIVRGIHYDDHFQIEHIARKLVRSNISDISAMGGVPTYALANISTSRGPAWTEKFSRILIDELKKMNTELIGGDFSRAIDDTETLSLTIFGQAHPDGILLRAEAQPGDIIAVTGSLGGPASILKYPEKDSSLHPLLYDLPNRLSLANNLVKHGVKSGIDLSDGFLKDLSRICTASRVGAKIDHRKIPVHEEALSRAPDEESAVQLALSGGEDYELLITFPDDLTSTLENLPLHFVGTITEQLKIDFEPELPGEISTNMGWDHFS